MKSNRPKIKVPAEGLDIVIDLISVTILLGMTIYIVMSYSDLPETIPSHFNVKGKVDGYSKKYTLLFLPIVSFVLFTGMFILNKHPHLHNYMVTITEKNALKHYRFSTRIVRFSNLFVMALFAIISYTMISSAKGNEVNLTSWFLPMVIGISIILPIIIIVYQKKFNNT